MPEKVMRVEVVQPREPEPLPTIAEMERYALKEALINSTPMQAARRLGVGKDWVYARMERYGLKAGTIRHTRKSATR